VTTQVSPLSSPYASMTKRAVIRAVLVAAVIAVSLVVVDLLEVSLRLTFDKPPAPLTKPLPMLKDELGNPVRYRAAGPDENMDPEVVEVLGTKDYLLRNYRDLQKKPSELGNKLALNLNYYSMGSATPHVPEVCWAGSGLVEKTEARRRFTVRNVRRKDGTVVDIPMRMVSFYPKHQGDMPDLLPDKAADNKLLNVAYTFEVNGQYVATPKEVISTFWKAENKYAYHTKIEVTIKDAYCDPADAEQIVSDFIREAIPEIEQCLPDARRLNEESSGNPTTLPAAP